MNDECILSLLNRKDKKLPSQETIERKNIEMLEF